MKKKWMVCMIACLMILLAGCNGNTAKETARNDTDKRISSTAGNTETTTGTEKADDTSDIPETEQTVSSEAATELSPQEKSDVSSTAGGRTFGSVSSKEIAQEAKKQLDFDIDKKKIVLDEPIRTLGTHVIQIKLHKDVTAKMNVKVQEA